MRFYFDLHKLDGGLNMRMTRWSVLGVPLPLAWAPRSPAREWEEGGRFHFDVLDLPLIGRVIHYRGWLVPSQSSPAAGQNGTSSSRSASKAAGCGRDWGRDPPPPPPENPPSSP